MHVGIRAGLVPPVRNHGAEASRNKLQDGRWQIAGDHGHCPVSMATKLLAHPRSYITNTLTWPKLEQKTCLVPGEIGMEDVRAVVAYHPYLTSCLAVLQKNWMAYVNHTASIELVT